MASGPEHYREAERLLTALTHGEMTVDELAVSMSAALVHAKLADIAARIDAADESETAHLEAWTEAVR